MRAPTSCFLPTASALFLTSAIATAGATAGAFAGLFVSVSTAHAVPLPATCTPPGGCASGQRCIDAERLGIGVCMPTICAMSDTGLLRTACFGPGTTIAEAFASGDCDGDLVPNDAEDDARLCEGAAVIAVQAGGEFQWTEPARLDAPMGLAIAPYDATSTVSHAVGIGCTPTRRCPALPSEPRLRSRCVLVIPGVDDPGGGEEVEPRGVCTYYTDDRDDDSCLDGLDTSGCLSGIDEAPHAQWEHGDCDLDGLQNKADPDVCDRVEVVGRVSGGDVRCVSGAVQGACFSGVGEIASSVYGCADDEPADFAPFAYCCRSHEDCPAPYYFGDASRGRCVFLGSDATAAQVGACTYDEAGLPDDDSCIGAMPALGATCLSTADVSYTTWASGNCDACDRDPNATDDVVCSECGMGDAGMNVQDDASTPADAGGGVTDDSAIPSLDANAPDAAPSPPSSFAGSGCRCGIASRGAAPPPLAWLTLLLMAAPLLGRRKL